MSDEAGWPAPDGGQRVLVPSGPVWSTLPPAMDRTLAGLWAAPLVLLSCTPFPPNTDPIAIVARPPDAARSEVATVRMTYNGGDAAAGPQTMTGRDDASGIFLTAIHTVNIDFASFITDACVGDQSLALRLHKMNQISAIHVLELNTVDPATSGGNHIRWGNISIDGKLYDVLFSNFQTKTSMRDLMVTTAADPTKTPETTDPTNWDGYVLEGGRFYVIQTSPRQVRLNCPGVVDLELLIVR